MKATSILSSNFCISPNAAILRLTAVTFVKCFALMHIHCKSRQKEENEIYLCRTFFEKKLLLTKCQLNVHVLKSNNLTFIFELRRWRFDFSSVGLQEVCCTVEPRCREMISDEFRHCDILRSHSFHCVTFFQHHVLQFGKTLKWRCGVYP